MPIGRMEAIASAAGIAATQGAANRGQVRGKSQPEWPEEAARVSPIPTEKIADPHHQ